jgi:osmotically-inducible protein OsmY
VPSYPEYVEAAAVARRAPGVTAVHNQLTIAPPRDDYRDDAALTAMANDALSLNHAVPVGVTAAADNGDVTLTGTV